jgi:nucleoid DNA-binding protein
MLKKDIVSKLSEDSCCYKISQKQISKILTKAISIITEALFSGEDILLRGFGHFHVKYRRPREINHPVSKEKIMSKPKHVVSFEPARNVKQKLKKMTDPGTGSGSTKSEV